MQHPSDPRNAAPVAFALYQPDIPQNAGNLLRTAACFQMPVHVIEPCGFVLSDARLRRSGMDYMEHLEMTRHDSWQSFRDRGAAGRIVLLTTRAVTRIPAFRFEMGDILLLGRESAGVPDDVHAAVDAQVALPMASGLRSLNVAVAGAIAAYEALRQLHGLPGSNTMPPDSPAGDEV